MCCNLFLFSFSETSQKSSCHRNSLSPPLLAATNRKTDPNQGLQLAVPHRVASDSRFQQSGDSPIPLRFFRRKLSDSQLLTESGARLLASASQGLETGSPVLTHGRNLQPMAAGSNQDMVDRTLQSYNSIFSQAPYDCGPNTVYRRRSSSVLPVVEIPSLTLKDHPTLMGLLLTEAADQESDKTEEEQVDTHSALFMHNT